jgi:6-phospho-beta-glucosidase
MKLVILGGGGFRVPLVYAALLRDRMPGRVTQVALVDVDARKLEVNRRVLAAQAREYPDAPEVSFHADFAEALPGADFVFSAMRVGGLEGRADDERIGQARGVIGQETVGFGGISYALRTLPTALEVARIVQRLAPEAWVINFTNPAGIVTEAMSTVLGDRVIGICDSPIALARRSLRSLGIAPENAEIHYAGLNHLGWLTGLVVDGTDVLPGLLARPDLLATFEEGRLFGAEWLSTIGAIPNEYLHYYLYRREVLHADQLEVRSRGRYLQQQIENYTQLATTGDDDPVVLWESTRRQRESTYMAANRLSAGVGERDEEDLTSGGYEDVAIALMRGIAHDQNARLILNVRNRGALAEFDDDAVVEVPCIVDATGANPIPGSSILESGRGLVHAVKYVERQTIEAGLSGSRLAAARALAHHPLIDSVAVAQGLLNDALDTFPQLEYLR